MRRRSMLTGILVLSLILCVGCAPKPEKEPAEQGGNPGNMMEIETDAVDLEPEGALIEDPPVVIDDIDAWKHPLKDAMEAGGFVIKKVELYKDSTYPVLYVQSEWGLNPDTQDEYLTLLRRGARANGYWSYELENTAMPQVIEVVCDDAHSQVMMIRVDGVPLDTTLDSNGDGEDVTATAEEALRTLQEQVPEIAEYHRLVTNSGTGAKPLIRIDGEPDLNSEDPYQANFFQIYVGESMETHTNRWATFMVRKDLQEVLVEDVVNGGYLSLEAWRRQQAAD